MEATSTAVFGQGAAVYRPICTLARGGMGRVDLCVRRSGSFERLYAVKRLHSHLREEETMRSMFLDEAKVAGLVRHANVVSVLDVGDDAEGPYLVMDYVEGVSLSRLIKRQVELGRPMPIPLCAEIVAQAARGLHAAHQLRGSDGALLSLVHRDVSPQNILVGRDGVVRVTDFGIAKTLGGSNHTRTGLLKGKVGYMSPEALRFERIDQRADLFALGVVLYELLCMRRLYKGDDAAEVARRILSEVPPDLGEDRPDAPPQLVELCFELLAKDRNDRPPTAQEVADRLEQHVVEHGEVVDIREHIGHAFGADLEAERERISGLVEHLDDTTLVRGANTRSGTEPTGARSARLGWLGAGGLAVAAAAASIYVLSAWSRDTPRETTHEPAAGSAATVTLSIDTRPQKASIAVGDELVGETPVSLQVSRSDDSVVINATREGYLPADHQLVPNRDHSIFLTLTPEPEPEPKQVEQPPPEPTTDPATARPKRPRGTRSRKRRESKAQEPPTPKFRKFD